MIFVRQGRNVFVVVTAEVWRESLQVAKFGFCVSEVELWRDEGVGGDGRSKRGRE